MRTLIFLAVIAAQFCVSNAVDETLVIPTIKPGLKCEKLDLVFLIDDSQSVGPNDFAQAKRFMKALVHEFSVNLDETRVALVTFNTHARVIFRLRDSTDEPTVDRLIDSASSTTGHTNTAEALQLIRSDVLAEASGARISAPNVVVFISDGYHSEDTADPVAVAEQIRRTSNTTIISIGIAGQNGVLNATRYRELIGISGAASLVFNSSTYQHLDELKGEIIRRFPCAMPLRCAGDITFLIETSEKVGELGVEAVKGAVIDMMGQLDITNRRSDRDHVALAHFSDPNSRTAVLFNLDNGQSFFDLKRRVQNMNYNDVLGVSDFRRGLRLVVEDVYSSFLDRSLQPNIVIVFAQGFYDHQSNCCDPPFSVAAELRNRKNAEIYSIILPPKKNYTNLARVTTGHAADHSRIFEFSDYDMVTQIVKDYLKNFNCLPITSTSITTTASPPPPCHCPIIEHVVDFNWYYFESCNYPHPYSNDLDCQWFFTSFQAGLSVEFMCVDFNTEFMADFLSVFDGRNMNDPTKLITKLSGIHQGTPSVYSSGSVLSVLFHTNDQGVRRGWQCRVRAHVPPTGMTPTPTTVTTTPTTSPLTSTPTTTTTPVGCYADITFIIETSELVGFDRVEAQKEAAIEMLAHLSVAIDKTHTAVAHFSSPDHRSGVLLTLNQGTDFIVASSSIRNGINWNTQRGNTDLELGLSFAADDIYGRPGDRPHAGNVVVLMAQGFYDHLPNCCPDPIPEAMHLQTRATVFALALGPNTDRQLLERITGNPSQVYDFSQHGQLLVDIVAMLANGQLCPGGTIATQRTTPTTVMTTPTPTISIATHSPPTQSPDCQYIDLVFVLDSSESVVSGDHGPGNRLALKEFLIQTTQSFYVGRQKVQIGVVLFNNMIRIPIVLDQFATHQALEDAVRRITFTTGITDTAAGLNSGANMIRHHGRPTAPHAIVLVTDGFHSPGTSDPIPVAQSIRNDGITIVAVGVKGTNGASETIRYAELLGIAGRGDRVFNVTQFGQLIHYLGHIIEVLPCEPCTCTDVHQQLFPGLHYQFQSCNFPTQYGNNLHCLWFLEAAQGNRVQLNFLNITTASNDCITVFEGHGTSGPIITRQCGHINPLPLPFKSSGNMMTVLFQTDGAITDIGFSATATAIVQEHCFGDVTFIVEVSELLQNNGVEMEKQAMMGMVRHWESLHPGIIRQDRMHISAVRFSDRHNIDNSAVVFNLNRGFPARFVTESIRTGIDWNSQHGLTNLRLGLQITNDQVLVPGQDRPTKPNIVVLLAEGFWDTKRAAFPPPFDQADILRQKATIYALASGPEENRANLRRITGAQDHVYELRDYSVLADRIANDLYSGAACGTQPPQPCQGVNLATLVTDIIIIFDSSSGIGATNFHLVRTALTQFVNSGYAVTPAHDRAQFGLMSIARDGVTPLFLLNTYTNVLHVSAVIGLVPFRGTNGFDLNSGLTSAENLYMTTGGGYRQNANHLLLVVGGSQVTGADPVPLASHLRQRGLNIVAMGVGPNADMATLQAVAGGASCAFQVNSAADIAASVARLQGYTCRPQSC